MGDDQTRDFIGSCVAATTGNPLLDEIRDRSADAVLAVFRIVKNGLVHAIDNDAMVASASQSQQVLASFAAEVGVAATITFAGDTVFVCGQLLRASRKVYEATLELGKLLARCGVSEIGFEPALSAQELLSFAEAVSIAVRDPQRRNALLELVSPNVSVRKLELALKERVDDDKLPAAERILRSYGVALMVMRAFFDSVANGVTLLPHRVKRLAQKLVVLSELGHPAMFGMVALANAHRDDAGRAVQGAILALLLARQITTDRVTLSRVVMAALMADVGRVRVLGPEKRDTMVALSEQIELSIPPSTSAVCIATGGINFPSALRSIIALETTWLEREKLLGPLYGGKAALPQAEILRIVRRLLDLLAPRDTSRPLAPVDALAAVALEPRIDRGLLRLLVRALGILPASSVVEFETGEWAVVMGPSENREAPHKPKVKLVTDRQGRALERPREIDLGATAEGQAFPRIVGVVEPDRARFNVTQAFVTP